VNNLNNATKRLLLNQIFVQRLANNTGQHEQSLADRPWLVHIVQPRSRGREQVMLSRY
jgi:hypothetical protein